MIGPTVDRALGEQRAWGWVAHLREGGTTPWQRVARTAASPTAGTSRAPSSWSCSAGSTPPAARTRRSARACWPPPPRAAAGPTSSSSDAGPESAFGPAPVDPAELPAGELVRVAASVLADQVVDAGVPATARASPASWTSWWRRGYRLVGDPELADLLRAQLVARGRPPGGREPRIVVLGSDLATMAAHAWTHRAFTEGVTAWREWLRLLRERREVPARADVLAVARAWERRVGKERVHVVLEPHGQRARARLVGDRRPLAAPVTLPGECGELARRVGSVLGLLVLPDDREALLTTRLRPRIEAASLRTPGGRPLVVPAAHRDWFESAAEQMREGIRRAGYAVHGDLDALVPHWPADDADHEAAHAGPSPEATLDLAIQVLLDHRSDGGRTP